ncbi:MAG: VanZ family protein [Candidatus Pacearchaeota archaeon]|nr:VanZ family protein [Nanoarchaeota archaeon]MDZ4226779.1 VanZ family protein [Candidatus Pacearchaeota archaeon]
MIKWLEKKRIFAVVLAVLIAAEIFFFSSISGFGLPEQGGLKVSIIYHFSFFFLLNFFLLISFNGNKGIKFRYLVAALILSVIYAVLDEIHQLFVPFRYAAFGDIMIDNIGIFLSTLIYLYYKK